MKYKGGHIDMVKLEKVDLVQTEQSQYNTLTEESKEIQSKLN